MVSANADPTLRNCAPEIPTRGIRRGQPKRSAMQGPHSGQTACLIAVKPTPGKYEFVINRLVVIAGSVSCVTGCRALSPLILPDCL